MTAYDYLSTKKEEIGYEFVIEREENQVLVMFVRYKNGKREARGYHIDNVEDCEENFEHILLYPLIYRAREYVK